ncbi:hypothetical protein [Streptomyces sp. NPDC017673]
MTSWASFLGRGFRWAVPEQALAENQIAALWRLDVGPREKTFWKMLHE